MPQLLAMAQFAVSAALTCSSREGDGYEAYGVLSVVWCWGVQARASYKCHLMQHPLHDWMPAVFPPPSARPSPPPRTPAWISTSLVHG